MRGDIGEFINFGYFDQMSCNNPISTKIRIVTVAKERFLSEV